MSEDDFDLEDKAAPYRAIKGIVWSAVIGLVIYGILFFVLLK